ncbi:MAG: tetratricopeptide repeat protein [bacterium]
MNDERKSDVQHLGEHLKDNPDSILFARYADTLLHENRVDEAIEMCESGLKKHPYYVTGHMILGKCYLAKKLYDQAEKEFKRVLLFDPKYLSAQKHYGDLMKEIGWENTCEMSYRKILQVDPLDEVAQSMVGDYILEGESVPTEEDVFEPDRGAQPVLDNVAPVTESPEEEEFLFQEPAQSEVESAVQTEQAQPEIDEKKAEEFSYILEDIFKDEITDEQTRSAEREAPGGSAEGLDLEAESDADSYLAGLQMPEKMLKEPESEPQQDSFAEPDVANNKGLEPKPNIDFSTRDFGPAPEPAEPEKKPEPVFAKSKKSSDQKIVTPTLGEIYAAQGQYAKAIVVFETLLKKHPDNPDFANKINELKNKLNEMQE